MGNYVNYKYKYINEKKLRFESLLLYLVEALEQGLKKNLFLPKFRNKLCFLSMNIFNCLNVSLFNEILNFTNLAKINHINYQIENSFK